jgi:hypothetical protein
VSKKVTVFINSYSRHEDVLVDQISVLSVSYNSTKNDDIIHSTDYIIWFSKFLHYLRAGDFLLNPCVKEVVILHSSGGQ